MSFWAQTAQNQVSFGHAICLTDCHRLRTSLEWLANCLEFPMRRRIQSGRAVGALWLSLAIADRLGK